MPSSSLYIIFHISITTNYHLKFSIPRVSRKSDCISNIFNPRHVANKSFKSEAIACMRYGTIATKIKIPADNIMTIEVVEIIK